MEEPTLLLANGNPEKPAPKPNRGWFRPGDGRINRDGRPKGSTKPPPGALIASADLAPRTDRLMLLKLPCQDLAARLAKRGAEEFVKLPADFEIIGSRVDAASGCTVFVIRSATFARIARGAPIPEFTPQTPELPFNGQLCELDVPVDDFHLWFAKRPAPWITNLPCDYRIVDTRFGSDSVILTLHSGTFSPVLPGEPIPAFQAKYKGLGWRK
jgi:hypothetical protein